MTFPKLKYPILTKGMDPEHRLIVLAYDMLWRLRKAINEHQEFQSFASQNTTYVLGYDDKHDLDANLANLGYHIEHIIFNGDSNAIFEEYKEEHFNSNQLEITEQDKE